MRRVLNRLGAIGTAIAVVTLGAYIMMGVSADTPVPPNYVFGIDSSYNVLTDQEAQDFKAGGGEVYVQALTALPFSGLERPNSRIISLRNAQEAYITPAGYLLVGSLFSGSYYVDFARQDVPDDVWNALAFVAIDVEVPGIWLATVQEACDRLAELGKSPCVIYTNYNSWTSHVVPANPAHPPGWLLWNASWDDSPDLDYERHPFGNWQTHEIIGEQWSGGVEVAGQFADRDIFHVSVLNMSSPLPEPVPADCGPVFYDREEGLWALSAVSYFYGATYWHPGALRATPPDGVNPYDVAIVRHIACLSNK